MVLEHLSNLMEEDLGLRLDRSLELNFLLLSGMEEDFALRQESSERGSKSRETEGDLKQCTPSCAWDKVHIDDSGNEVSDSIVLSRSIFKPLFPFPLTLFPHV